MNWRDLIVGTLASLGVVGVFLLQVEPAPRPPEMQVLEGSTPSRIWVGNSVAQRAIASEQLPDGEARLALDGSQLGHWVAALERLALQDTQVVVYASTLHLADLELSGTRDQELFWALAPGEGGLARPWAVQQAPWMGPILLERARWRDRALSWAARWPARALWGTQADALLDQAQGHSPVRPTAIRGQGPARAREPETLPTQALQDLVQVAGGSVVWVLPYQREARPCVSSPLVEALAAQPGLRVVDLSAVQLPKSWFGSEMHLMPMAQARVTRDLVERVDGTQGESLTLFCE